MWYMRVKHLLPRSRPDIDDQAVIFQPVGPCGFDCRFKKRAHISRALRVQHFVQTRAEGFGNYQKVNRRFRGNIFDGDEVVVFETFVAGISPSMIF